MRIALNVVGILGLFVGFVWFFQGIGVLPGSFMTGQIRWAVYGALVALASLVLLTRVRRRRPKE
jgi:hypothetical protein